MRVRDVRPRAREFSYPTAAELIQDHDHNLHQTSLNFEIKDSEYTIIHTVEIPPARHE